MKKYYIYILFFIIILNTANAQIVKKEYSWIYKGQTYSMDLILNSRTYEYYKNSDKRLLFTKDSAIGKFMNIKDNDNLIQMIVNKLIILARKNKIPEKELPEFAAAFVQYIDYDSAKANKILTKKWDADTELNFHYETVYRNKGVCTDKSILMVSILRKLGFGAALLLMENEKHAAAAILSSGNNTLNNSGYKYIETTAPAAIGAIPNNIAVDKIEILQKTNGKKYFE